VTYAEVAVVQNIEQTSLVACPALETLAGLIEQMSRAVVGTEADDLNALAALHTSFQQVSAAAEGAVGTALAGQLEQVSRVGEQIVERIILREVDDAAASMRSIAEAVSGLQELIKQATSGTGPTTPAATRTPAAPANAEVATAAALVEKTHAIDAETVISPDDVLLAHEFIAEATSHLEAAEANLLKIEEGAGDGESVNAIFRSFHTIKGVAGFLNLKQIGALAHAAENLLDLARKGELELAGSRVDIVFESVDVLKALLSALDVAVKSGQAIGLEARLPNLLTRLEHAAAGTPAPACETPATSKLPAATDPTQPVAAGVSSTSAPAGSIAAGAAKSADSAPADTSVKVSTERLDALINMVGELVIAQSMVDQDVATMTVNNHRVERNLTHLGKLTRELQDLSMSMRMVPIQGVFQKMARVVRDIARKAGKEVDFAVVGAETELDRNVVEAIADPLVHMVRNSVDHGVEPPEARIAAGKSRAGRVELRARHQAGHIVIEIADDGRGLNTEKILKKAREAGIVREGEELTEQQIFQLIFHAGLSTAEKITDISGRGVGMDVVRRNVEALRGRIDIRSTPGAGTTFTIHLPLTLAVIDGLIVRVGSERYIIPITSIEQSIRPKAEQISTIQERGEMCLIRGRLLPLTRLYRLFNVKPRTESPAEALVVIIHDNQRQCCLLVDELLGQQQVVIKNLGESVGHVRGVSGGAILGDGSISLILDVPGLIDLASGK
jgi:two-component system chemotaxis sensor kinase CheA